MAVDTDDPTVPAHDEGYAIYVLDLLNPQVLPDIPPDETKSSVVLEYRLQKLGLEGEILASRKLTLASSTTAPGLHAVALALDGAGDRVYVLLADQPPIPENSEGANAAYAIEGFTAGREGEPALAPAGQLVGPATLQPAGPDVTGLVMPNSLAVAGVGSERTLALGGSEYTSPTGNEATPFVERFALGGEHPGSPVGTPWGGARGAQDLEAAEDEAAKYWWGTGVEDRLFAMSANPNGSLNLIFGPRSRGQARYADEEPIMATLAPDLASATPILPWESAGRASEGANLDQAATIAYQQEIVHQGAGLQTSAATSEAGSLAPSAVALSGGTHGFPEGVYAGLVAHAIRGEGIDPQSGKPLAWARAGEQFNESEEEVESVISAHLGIRLFDAQGESLGMIGNIAAGGPCNLQGGPYGESYPPNLGSFTALAAGRGGTLFALVQPDLDSKVSPFGADPAAPLAKTVAKQPLHSVQGDQVVEFAPGAGQHGLPGEECPQPSGEFSVTNATLPGSTPSTGSSPIAITAGETLKLDASTIDLRGGSPWAYDWESGDGQTRDDAWVAENGWQWPSPTVEFQYPTPGTYTATLHLVNDFGTLAAQRTVEVTPRLPVSETKVTVAGTPVAGQLVTLEGSASFPARDWAVDYHWEFGDGEGEDQPGGQAQSASGHIAALATQVQHVYTAARSYTVTMTVIDRLGQVAKATTTIAVAPPPPEPPSVSPPSGKPVLTGSLDQGTLTPAVPAPPAASIHVKAIPSRLRALAKALSACRRGPKRRRASCEKRAHKRYGRRSSGRARAPRTKRKGVR